MDHSTIPQLTIIIPFHHEEELITSVITSLKEHLKDIPHETLLIHDDMADPTLKVIAMKQDTYPSMKTLINNHAPGVPGAIRTGLKEAQGEYILFMVADDPSPSALIPHMLKHLQNGCDLVAPSRYTHGGKAQGADALARLLSCLANRLFSLLSGSKISDITCGIKMFRQSMLNQITLTSNADWTIPFELAVRAQYHHFNVCEIPYISHNRLLGGKSHFKLLPRIFNYSRIFIWGIIMLWKRRLHV